MARIEKRVATKQKALSGVLPFTKLNYQILGAGILCIILRLCGSCTRSLEWNNATCCCTDIVGARVLCDYTNWYSLS